MNNKLFNYLFKGAKSSKHERVEDFATELLGFMWEIDSEFKKAVISYLKEKKKIYHFNFESFEFETQTVVKANSNRNFRYDFVLTDENDKKIIIENKIDSQDNQFIEYLKSKSEKETFFLLIPKRYEKLKNIEKNYIIYWEELILYLKSNFKIDEEENNVEENNVLKKLRKSFFNYLFDYAGLYDDTNTRIPDSLLNILKKKIKSKTQKSTFLICKSLFPLGFHHNATKPSFGIEIDDFFNKIIKLILEDDIIKIKENKKEHEDEINILKKYDKIDLIEKENDKSFFTFNEVLNNNLPEIKNNFIEFIEKFYEQDLARTINKELDEFIDLIKKLIDLSGTEEDFKENILKYYVFLKSEQE